MNVMNSNLKKSPKTTIYKSVVTTFILLYHTGVYTFKASFSLYVNMPSSSENYVHRFKVFIAGLNTIKICLIRSVKVRSQALLWIKQQLKILVSPTQSSVFIGVLLHWDFHKLYALSITNFMLSEKWLLFFISNSDVWVQIWTSEIKRWVLEDHLLQLI